jgi:aspartate/methionine/tyrosine aminotransferase
MAFGARLLDEAGVAVAPGVDFDPADGGRYVRMCFAGDASELDDAVERMGRWLAR